MALDFNERCPGTDGQHTTPIGERSVFVVERMTDNRYRIRTRAAKTGENEFGIGWGAELTHEQAVEVTRIMAKLCAMLAERDEDDA